MIFLVIGNKGQIGSAIQKILSKKYSVKGIDKGDILLNKKFDAIFVCIPYDKNFVKEVKRYQKIYLKEGGLTIIHSTVQIGTTEKLDAVHAPIRGKHPDLYEGIKTFGMGIGGIHCGAVAYIYTPCGISCHLTISSRETEAFKLFDTEYYRRCILFMREVYEFCEKNDLDFDFIYRWGNESYNAGYSALGMSQFVRPILKYVPGPVGGHCIEPNHKLLKQCKKRNL